MAIGLQFPDSFYPTIPAAYLRDFKAQMEDLSNDKLTSFIDSLHTEIKKSESKIIQHDVDFQKLLAGGYKWSGPPPGKVGMDPYAEIRFTVEIQLMTQYALRDICYAEVSARNNTALVPIRQIQETELDKWIKLAFR